MKIIIGGYTIEAHPKSFSDPAHVTVHKLGTDSRSWLTPAEARAVAAAIMDAAKTAESGLDKEASAARASAAEMERLPL